MDSCPRKCVCPVCGVILSNKMTVYPGGKVKAFCPQCEQYVSMENFQFIIKGTKNVTEEN
jgi:hypothetical protein